MTRSYLDIGHEFPDNVDLWSWIDGRIETVSAMEHKYHSRWKHTINRNLGVVCGRIDHSLKEISIELMHMSESDIIRWERKLDYIINTMAKTYPNYDIWARINQYGNLKQVV